MGHWTDHTVEIEDHIRELEADGRLQLARVINELLYDASHWCISGRAELEQLHRDRRAFRLTYSTTSGDSDRKLRAAAKAAGLTPVRSDWPVEPIGSLHGKTLHLVHAYVKLRSGDRSLYDERVQSAREPGDWATLWGTPDELAEKLRDSECDRSDVGALQIVGDLRNAFQACELLGAFYGLKPASVAAELRRAKGVLKEILQTERQEAEADLQREESLARELGGSTWDAHQKCREESVERHFWRVRAIEALLGGLADGPSGWATDEASGKPFPTPSPQFDASLAEDLNQFVEDLRGYVRKHPDED